MADETSQTQPEAPVDIASLITQADAQLSQVATTQTEVSTAQASLVTARENVDKAVASNSAAVAAVQALGRQIVDAAEKKYLLATTPTA